MAEDPKGNMAKISGPLKDAESSTKVMGKNLLDQVKSAEKLEKLFAKIRKDVEATTKAQSSKTGGSSMPGLGAMGPGAVSGADQLRAGTYGQGSGLSRGGAIAYGAMQVAGSVMGILPSTMSAVSTRMAAEAITMMSTGNRGPRATLMNANKMVGDGVTSLGSPTRAMGQMLSMGGYGGNSATTRNVMRELGGMSAASMQSNEAVAGGIAGANGMAFLRIGVRLRDQKGNIRPMSTIANELYSKLYRGTDPKNPELIYNPRSMEHVTVMALCEGDASLFQTLASLLIARAKNKKALTGKDLGSSKNMLNIMGNPNSVMGSNFKFQTSQNRLSQASESGAVAGYQASVGAASMVNDGLSRMGEILPGVINGLSGLKGVLETLPRAGGAGGFLSGLGGNLATLAGARMMMGKSAIPAAKGAMGFLGKAGSVGMKAGVTGLGLGIAGTAIANGQPKGGARSRVGNAAKWAGFASILNLLGPEIGIPAMAIAGAAGAALGGGESSPNMNPNSNGSEMMLAAPGKKGDISSAFGDRNDPNNPGVKQHHGGIDYAMPVGSSVPAAADGVVSKVTTQAGTGRSFGTYIMINHKELGLYTLYAHLSKTLVNSGQKVSKGQIIALSGGAPGAPGAGSSTGPHLHFEVRKTAAGKGVNPTSFFSRVKSFLSNMVGGNKSVDTSVLKNSYQGLLGKSASYQKAAEMSGQRLSSLLAAGSSLSYEDIMKFEKDGGLKSAAAKSDGVLGDLSTNSSTDTVKGDKGSMAFGSRVGLIKGLQQHGFKGKNLQTAFAVSLAESGGRANASNFVGRDLSYGLFQINMKDDDPKSPNMGRNRRKQFGLKNNEQLYDANTNSRAAYEISNKGSWWKQWSTYNSGAFTKYLDDSEAAAKKAGIPTARGGAEDTTEGLMYVHDNEAVLNAQEAGRYRNRPNNGGGGCITVNMNVSIAQAGVAEVQVLLANFKTALENDAGLKRIGAY